MLTLRSHHTQEIADGLIDMFPEGTTYLVQTKQIQPGRPDGIEWRGTPTDGHNGPGYYRMEILLEEGGFDNYAKFEFVKDGNNGTVVHGASSVRTYDELRSFVYSSIVINLEKDDAKNQPRCCPWCSSTRIGEGVEWRRASELEEYECEECYRSFWCKR